MELFGISAKALFGQLLLGLINGSFYAVMSLGLAVIFGLLHVINFAHGALFMIGAFVALLSLKVLGLNYWFALIVAPLVVGVIGVIVQHTMLRRLASLDPLYGLLLTFGLAMIAEGLFAHFFGASGESYPVPELLQGGVDLGFMYLPLYRGWVVVAALTVCVVTWYVIERTSLGATLRAATEKPQLVQVLGINVPVLVTLTFAAGVALAGLAGVLAAPVTQVDPMMGSHLMVVVFAVVVIGGMGSIFGSVVTGLALGLIEGLTKIVYPEAAGVVIFVVMVVVLLVRPAGLFGKQA